MLNKKFKLSLITLSVIYALTPYTEAALVRDDVDYQIFRDFAENKGKFFVGATDLSVKNKQGQNIGNALSNVPMIDFSVADVNKRIATVVDPQYAVSVKHAKAEVHTFYYGQYNGHNDVADKENEYRVVEQNNYEPHKAWSASNLGRLEDYNMARFNKFVTEVAPIAPTDAGGGLDTYKDKNRFSSFVRVGAGRQLVYEKGAYHQEGNEKGYDLRDLSQAYRYAIAGTPYKDINIDQTMNTEGLIGFGNHNKQYSAEELKQALSQDALTNYGVLGDSGSPLFAFDKQKNQWVFLGTYDYWAGYGKKSWQEWNIYKKEFADKIKQRDNAGTIKGDGEHHWNITSGTNSKIGSTAVRLAHNERDANNGQNVTFEDNGTLVLDQNINQGAGGLFFKGDYTVKGAHNDITWLGAGIDVADGKKVVWQVKNPNGDRLAKIGKGTLEINGTGVNQGQLKVGDGTVILNQQADSNQKVQAFSQVGIVSGRGTLVLNSSNQINPDNLYFGFRGGRLDANGNDLTFEHIRNVDEGARIVNHNTGRASTITLTGKSLITVPQNLSVYEIRNDYDEDDYYGYYSYRKPIPQGKDLYYKNYRYYALKSGGSVNAPMPDGVAENNDWVFMGYTQEEAKKNAMNHKNNQRISSFSGFFGEENGKGHNGALNLNFNGKSAQNRFLLTGGANLNGKISVTQGNVLLSGRPTPHARDFVNKSSARKDAHFSKNNEVVFEDDWINRTFKATEIAVNQSASFSSGRNVSDITANITATDNAKVNLGYKNGDEVCVRSDYTGYVTCNTDNLSDKALNSFDATQINGNVNLNQNAALVLGKAALWGQIQGQGNSRVSLNQHSKWHLTGDSQVHNLSLADSHIHLNNASDAQSANKYHTLKINHLSGNGHFHYLTHLAKNLGDKVVVKESASGHYQLHVQDKTGEPNQEGLNLFDASSVQDRSHLSVSLANHYVDLGALRYTIKTENGITRLYNPYAENRRRVKRAPPPAVNTASQAQKATQTDGAQISKPQNIVVAPPSPQANQTEEALRQQAKAEQVKRQQAEAEKVARQKAEEAKRQQEALARQQEEARKAAELAKREKAEAERKAAELARQKAEEASHQANAKPKRRRRRAILPRPPAPVFSLDDYDAKDNSESSIGNLARVTLEPRMGRESIDDFEEIPLDVLEEAETTTNITENIGKDIPEIWDDESEDTDIEQLIDSLGQTVRLQPRTLSPIENMSQAGAISKNTNTALSDAMVSSQFILLDTGSSLVQQITQTELSANKENNVWVSNTTYDRHYSSTQYRQFSAKRSQIQIGIDHYLSKNTQVGTVLSYVRNSNVFDQASGKNTFVQANTYGKYYFDYGWYISGDIGVGQLRSQLQTQQKAKFNRIATQAGIMIGNRIDINRFEILPSIGVRYSYLSSIDYKLGSDSLKVDSISIKTALAKLDLAYQFNIGEFALKPILSMAYVINSGEGIVNIGGQNYRYKSDNQQQYSAGMALNYRNLTFNINGGAIKGRQLSNQKFLQIKMQVSF
ncbi:IgA-specific serine endopeptidase autotransporter precursor [Haemophilus influenzae]|uniref:S6 family peptidase n=1 Tax=Haemophilus influenzae TaxID=727 RepID=UPI000D01AFC3|nr:S6 family peptidase [Haemophilus influenzae]PRL04502.1 IgA-specific serine endopeptidase autotransporter precursor [Haemophilus influenzae]PRM49229.1 IgA-specific serine endopeptidase autotransporter precursor [Haemophilus influenzae]